MGVGSSIASCAALQEGDGFVERERLAGCEAIPLMVRAQRRSTSLAVVQGFIVGSRRLTDCLIRLHNVVDGGSKLSCLVRRFDMLHEWGDDWFG
jgi:hypothetical protein